MWTSKARLVAIAVGAGLIFGSLGCHSAAQNESTTEVQAPKPPEPSVQHGDFRDAFTSVAKQAIPSVVSIVSERSVKVAATPFDFFGGNDPFNFFFGRPGDRAHRPEPEERHESGLGSGFVVSTDGYILTNNHVVEGAQTLQVQLADEQTFDAKVVGTDKATDLAVIKLENKPKQALVPLKLGDSDKLQIGEWVVAVGAPFGLYETVTTGIISAKGRENTGITAFGNFLQTDAAINPGNSGGPLMNLEGQVVGINTAIYSKTGGYQGIGFAIPVNLAKAVMNSLIEHGKVTRGWLGVSIQSLSPEMADAMGLKDRKGALVGDVVADSPAEKAGIQRGDIIRSVDGKAVSNANDLMNRVALVPPGTKAELEILREGKSVTLKVDVGTRDEEKLEARGNDDQAASPGQADVAALGLSTANLSSDVRQRYHIADSVERGVVVTDVDSGGRAERAGLRVGDVIVDANREHVQSVADLQRITGEATKAGKAVLLLLERQGNTFFVVISPK